MNPANPIHVQIHFKRERAERPTWAKASGSVGVYGRFLLEWISDMLRRYKHADISFTQADVQRWDPNAFDRIYPPINPEDRKVCRVAFSAGSFTAMSHSGMPVRVTGTAAIMRRFQKEESEPVAFYVPECDARAMFDFAMIHLGKGFRHDMTDTFMAPRAPDGDKWFCVQYIVAILQAGGMLRLFNASALSADDLYFFIKTHYSLAPADVSARFAADLRGAGAGTSSGLHGSTFLV